MSEVNLDRLPALLDAVVPRVTPEDGLATKELMDWEQTNTAFFRTTVVALDTKLTTVSSKTDQNTASIVVETNARTNADAALAEQITTVTAAAQSTQAQVVQEAQARATADNALATQITNVSTTVNGHTAEISQLQSSVDGNRVRWQLQATLNGQSGGIYFTGVLDGTTGATYDITFVANQFQLYDPGLNGGSPTPVFYYGNGVFDFNVPVRVQTKDIGQQQVSVPGTAKTSTRSSYGASNDQNNWIDILTISTVGVAGGYTRICAVLGMGQQGTSGNLSSMRWRVWSDREGDLTGTLLPTTLAQCDTTGSPYNGFTYEPGLSYGRNSILTLQDDASQNDTIRVQVQNYRFSGGGSTLWIDRKSFLSVETQKR